MTACICRPRDPEGWYREDCPTHGRESFGEVVMQAEYDDGDPVMARTRILRADPRVRIAPELLDQAMDGKLRGITVSGEQDDVVTISDDYGQRFVYRLGQFDALHDAFEMEWPD